MDKNGNGFPLQPTPPSPPPSYGFADLQQSSAVTQQPHVVVINQTQAHYPPGFGIGRNGVPLNQYQVGLCQLCHSCSNLCLCLFCPCYLSGKVTGRLEENCCYTSLFGFLPLSVRFRTLAGVHQSMCEEGCTFIWCYHCAVLRLVNEMEEREFTMSRN